MATVFKIEKKIPMPTTRVSYPFGDMAVGDSFAFPADRAVKVRNAAHQHGKAHGVKFAVRAVDNETARVWRVA